MSNKLLDGRGYAGGERNRELTPEQVLWARQAAFEQRATAREIQAALAASGVMMGVESVRRMLRGDTYGNVGRQLPRLFVAPASGTGVPLVPEPTADEVAASADRLREALGVAPAAPAEVTDPAEILRRFQADVKASGPAQADAMLAELSGGGEPQP